VTNFKRQNMLKIPRVTALCASMSLAMLPLQASEATHLIVFVASTDRAAFSEIVSAYEKSHPNVAISTLYTASNVLMDEVSSGGSMDVVMMSQLSIEPLGRFIMPPHDIYKSHATIAVAKASATKVKSPGDLAAPRVRLAIASRATDVGTWQIKVLNDLAKIYGSDFPARVSANVVLAETNIDHIEAAFRAHEVDASILWKSEIDPATMVEIPLPPTAAVTETFEIAVVKASQNQGAAKDFVDFALGPQAAAIYASHGSGL
jgi:molybdate transport system substrate-binding protein